jgi:hypothetical protein
VVASDIPTSSLTVLLPFAMGKYDMQNLVRYHAA